MLDVNAETVKAVAETVEAIAETVEVNWRPRFPQQKKLTSHQFPVTNRSPTGFSPQKAIFLIIQTFLGGT